MPHLGRRDFSLPASREALTHVVPAALRREKDVSCRGRKLRAVACCKVMSLRRCECDLVCPRPNTWVRPGSAALLVVQRGQSGIGSRSP